MLPQKRCGVGRDAEAGLEELIVGLMDRGLWRRHGGESWKQHSQSQNEECDDFGKCGASVFHSRDDCAPLWRAVARFVTKSFEGIRLRASRLRRDTGLIVLA